MPVEVTYCATIREGVNSICIPGQELEQDFGLYREKLFNNKSRDGFIIISSDNNPEVRIQDELWAIVQNLCFSSIPNLVEHKNVIVRLYNNYGYIRLDPETKSVRISGDYIPDIRVNRRELITALYNCGNKFVKMIQGLLEFDPEYEDIIPGIQEYADEAKLFIEDEKKYKEF